MRNIDFALDEFYHVYNRGTEKRKIFLDDADYFRFTILLYLANGDRPLNMRDTRAVNKDYYGLSKIKQGEPLVDIGAYILMPNHFHLLLKERTEGGTSKFLHRVLTAYSIYFNHKYERNGTLWQGTFKAQHVDTDEYLKYLFSYIHLNLIKLIQSDWKEKGITDILKAKKYLNNYRYSSYLDYLSDDRYQSVILNKKAFPEYFSNGTNFKEELFDWLQFDPDKLELKLNSKKVTKA